MGDILEQDELDALMNNMGEIVKDEPTAAQDGEAYDFARQDYAVHRLIPALSLIQTHFADAVKEALRQWVPAVDSIRAERISVMKFGELKRSLAPPCDISCIQAIPLGAPSYLLFEPDLVFTLVDRFFGGSGKIVKARNVPEFSPAESRFMDMVSKALMPAYAEAWRSTLEVNPQIQGRLSDLRYIDDLQDADTVLATRFVVHFENLEAMFWLLLPWAAIDPVRESLGSGLRVNRQEQDAEWNQRLHAGVIASSLGLVATLPEISTSLKRVSAFKVGDILPIETPDIVNVSIEGHEVMTGSFGIHEGQVAIAVERIFKPTQSAR
ncbi:MAG: FliM/FliN family flagellar motor switch protein [Moraxellaceae bacterium]|nr:FliM/FliN family flagellar motor switch protein [Moraxellaceae bacterium]MDZ4296774.1 FliM/FliN family flagellar motor switch protein [Moraxellaceae bacterium]MDZ4387029.1 FliM/FliN family flagellar motor switch protein [Moraxellaceae bacterium]